MCLCMCMCLEEVVKRVHTWGPSEFVCLCVCVCALRGYVCDIYTPYCPFSSPLSTHHNCQYLEGYEAEKEERREPSKWILLLCLPVVHGKLDLALPQRIFTVPSTHDMVCCKYIL